MGQKQWKILSLPETVHLSKGAVIRNHFKKAYSKRAIEN